MLKKLNLVLNPKILAPELGGVLCEMLVKLYFARSWTAVKVSFGQLSYILRKPLKCFPDILFHRNILTIGLGSVASPKISQKGRSLDCLLLYGLFSCHISSSQPDTHH